MGVEMPYEKQIIISDTVGVITRDVTREFKRLSIVRKAKIMKSLMTSTREDEIIQITHEAAEKYSVKSDFAKCVVKECQEKYGNKWHCITGYSATSVNFENENYI